MREAVTQNINKKRDGAVTDTQPKDPCEMIRRIFLERRTRNPRYSTRAFARDLGMSQALLSMLMSGKRQVTLKQVGRISVLLGFDQKNTEAFTRAVVSSLQNGITGTRRAAPKHSFSVRNFDVERFRLISEWYHLPLMNLTLTKGFKNNPVWIAKRLGISPVEARDALERLLTLGLLEKKPDGTLAKANAHNYFATQKSEPAVRSFHKQMISKALQELDDSSHEAFENRAISSITMTAPRRHIKEASACIKKFQQEMAAFLTREEGDEVVQLNVQLFRLTKMEKQK